jgi:D-glycero-D-manno-heptose 1,7-bisphosphate phosphatase
MTGRPALFLDRDGTIILERHYLADPAGVDLVEGAVEGLRAFAAAGFALVVVTNQSGIARGLLTEAEFSAVQRRVEDALAAGGVRLDGVYHCPHHPSLTGPCECRKPGLALYRAAAERLGLDLRTSVYVGDRVSDVLPAMALGGRGYLVESGYGAGEAAALPAGAVRARDLQEVARREGVLPG